MVALDIAILPPPDVAALAIRLSTSLPAESSLGLRLDADHVPHISIAQLFVADSDVPAALDSIAPIMQRQTPLTLHVNGGGRGTGSVWIAVAPSAELQLLHSRVMRALSEFEQDGGTSSAFADDDARPADVEWVSNYRSGASFDAFTPHITLGHAPTPPHVRPLDFVADTVAACQLGKFCSCRRVLREWKLS